MPAHSPLMCFKKKIVELLGCAVTVQIQVVLL